MVWEDGGGDPASYPVGLIQQQIPRFTLKKLHKVGRPSGFEIDGPQPIREEYLLTGPLEPTITLLASRPTSAFSRRSGA